MKIKLLITILFFLLIFPGIGVCQVSKILGGAVYGPGPVPPPPPFVPDDLAHRGAYIDITIDSGYIYLAGTYMSLPPFFDAEAQKRNMTGILQNRQGWSSGASSFQAVVTYGADVYYMGRLSALSTWVLMKRNKTTWVNAYMLFYIPINGQGAAVKKISTDGTRVFGFGANWRHSFFNATGANSWNVQKILLAGITYAAGSHYHAPSNTIYTINYIDTGAGIMGNQVGGYDPATGAQTVPDVYVPVAPPPSQGTVRSTWMDGNSIFAGTNLTIMRVDFPPITTAWNFPHGQPTSPTGITTDSGNVYVTFGLVGIPTVIQKWTKAGGLLWSKSSAQVLYCIAESGGLLYLGGRLNGFPDNLYLERRDATTGDPI